MPVTVEVNVTVCPAGIAVICGETEMVSGPESVGFFAEVHPKHAASRHKDAIDAVYGA